jgi:hypothetical protein
LEETLKTAYLKKLKNIEEAKEDFLFTPNQKLKIG